MSTRGSRFLVFLFGAAAVAGAFVLLSATRAGATETNSQPSSEALVTLPATLVNGPLTDVVDTATSVITTPSDTPTEPTTTDPTDPGETTTEPPSDTPTDPQQPTEPEQPTEPTTPPPDDNTPSESTPPPVVETPPETPVVTTSVKKAKLNNQVSDTETPTTQPPSITTAIESLNQSHLTHSNQLSRTPMHPVHNDAPQSPDREPLPNTPLGATGTSTSAGSSYMLIGGCVLNGPAGSIDSAYVEKIPTHPTQYSSWIEGPLEAPG